MKRSGWCIGLALLGVLQGCGSDAPATMDTGVPTEGGADAGDVVAPMDGGSDASDAPSADTQGPQDGAGDGATDTGTGSDVTPMDGPMGDGTTLDGGAGDATGGDGTSGGDGTGGDSAGGDGAVVDGGGFALRPHRGGALVGAGGVMLSSRFRMVSTLGQSTVHVGTMRSAGFRLQGGLVGATGDRR
ncbi:MAG: hypothetical protein HY909_04290 [Deltaproteobacteria bacterium]|nr:hypothetical protein [Deltaproteobacteria bacterium]